MLSKIRMTKGGIAVRARNFTGIYLPSPVVVLMGLLIAIPVPL